MMGAKRRGHSERREKPFGEVRDQKSEIRNQQGGLLHSPEL